MSAYALRQTRRFARTYKKLHAMSMPPPWP